MVFDFVNVRTYKPLEPASLDFKFEGSEHYGVPTLTSLAFQYKGKRIEFVECIATVNMERNIVTTPMEGRDGTIKEYISEGDYTIQIDGAVTNYSETDPEKSRDYPVEKLQELLSFLKIKDSLEVQSDYLTLFGIKSVVVKSYGMLQETHSNRQAFQLQLLSDTPYEIKIKQDAGFSF
ncbi:DUF6046 domain-containing protein [Flavobacterium sp. TR2]|uniref:DUF6046 domain-containing protein n=1 Tax=Flavobacterium sp. TR2 TaxID=2977321 RepID=UPI0021B149DE|nr:DUF6046 domain-containing protein [Flavobacterium sp. TR2]UWY28800.1 DUF6046 domain-containing protein [Flavobacterium sp. TR2]